MLLIFEVKMQNQGEEIYMSVDHPCESMTLLLLLLKVNTLINCMHIYDRILKHI